MKLLTISGSLRANSSNTSLLEAVHLVAPPGVSVAAYAGLGELPPFNPDLDVEPAPPAVTRFRDRLRWADAVAISSPEYAHGVAGSMKNALDWIVGSGELVSKPVALINASPRATIAHEALAETLRTMSATLVPEASIAVPLPDGKPAAAEIAADPVFSQMLRAIVAALAAAVSQSA